MQRDHADLLRSVGPLLTPDGVLYFSTNRRRFRLDAALDEDFVSEDITRETIDEDFARHPSIHRVFRLVRRVR